MYLSLVAAHASGAMSCSMACDPTLALSTLTLYLNPNPLASTLAACDAPADVRVLGGRPCVRRDVLQRGLPGPPARQHLHPIPKS